MKFEKAEDNELLNRYVGIQKDGRRIQIGIYRVLFGYRIRAGYDGEPTYECDWCCGDNSLIIQATLRIMIDLLENGVPIKSLPSYSMIKPWVKDKEFIEKLRRISNNKLLPEMINILIEFGYPNQQIA